MAQLHAALLAAALACALLQGGLANQHDATPLEDALAQEGGAEDHACEAGDGECEALSLRQLRGETIAAEIRAHAAQGEEKSNYTEEEAECIYSQQYCGDFMLYETKADCDNDDTCRSLDAGDYGGAPGRAWYCTPKQTSCDVEFKSDDFQPVDELPEEMEPELEPETSVGDALKSGLEANAGSDAGWSQYSCGRRSCWSYVRGAACQCNSQCGHHHNCCSDYAKHCLATHDDNGAPAQESAEGNVMTLYHTTSVNVAHAILSKGFRPGHAGWCGGAIYFINQPYLPKTKYAPGITKSGAILQAEVAMGKMATSFSHHCSGYGGHGVSAARNAGYQSLMFNPGDGSEYIIWNPAQVKSVKIYKYM